MKRINCGGTVQCAWALCTPMEGGGVEQSATIMDRKDHQVKKSEKKVAIWNKPEKRYGQTRPLY